MKMRVEQLLQLTLQEAEKEASPLPIDDWIRQEVATSTAKTTPVVQPWLHGVIELLRGLKPERFQPATAELHKPAPKAEMTQELPMLGTIPAGVVREDIKEKVSVEVTAQPDVNDEGHLVLGVRVPEVQGVLESGEILELILINAQEEKPVGQLSKLCVREEDILDIELPKELREKWRRIINRKEDNWSELPFRFALRPATNSGGTILTGEAAGVQSQRKDDRHLEHSLHHHQVVTWVVPLTLLLVYSHLMCFEIWRISKTSGLKAMGLLARRGTYASLEVKVPLHLKRRYLSPEFSKKPLNSQYSSIP